MSKIELPTITSGYNLSTINDNFQKIEDALNKEVLYRKNYVGEPNEMQANLDMNSKEILNVSVGASPGSLVTRGYVDQEIAEERAHVDQELAKKFDKSGGRISGSVDMSSNEILNVSRLSANTLEVRGVQVVPTNLAIDPYNGTREALRRSYAELGRNLVDGSFEAGGTLVNTNDVLLQESTGKAFSGPAGIVAAGTDPTGGGFVDRSNLNSWTFNTISEATSITGMSVGQRVRWLGYHSLSDGGGNWGVVRSGAHVHDGGSIFTITPSLYIEANMKGQVIHAKKFGVVGDFDPSTGVGTDDRVSLQSAFDYAISVASGRRAKTVKLPQDSNIYLNGYSDLSAEAVILRYGRVDTRHKNVHIDGNGCSIFPGCEGRCLAIVNVESCLVKALKVYGYTGGSIGAWRENDAGIAVVYGSSDVTLDSIYVTNALGDQVLIGGSLSEAGGGQGWTAKDVTIKNSTLKERYGNGVRSYSGGTRSRLCVAVIDGRDITIRNNTIIGGVDIEPNLSGQKSINIDVNSNKFQSGYVTPQSVIGTDFWHDEPKGIVGGTVIEQSIVITGIPATPTVSGCRANNNSIESGYISTYADYRFDQIHSNNFQEGSIFVGDTSGSNYNVDFNVSYNQCLRKLTRENSFIVIKGNVLFSSFTANESIGCPCIGVSGGGSDGGRNTFLLNKVKRGSSVVLGFDLNPTSVEFGSTVTDGGFGKPTSVNSIAEASAVINRLASYTLPNSFNGAVDWGLIKSNVILLNQGAGGVATVTGFTGQIGDGHCIKVQFTASGGGACTLIHSPTFALKGSINVAPSLNSVMEFMFRTGVWFEISRSF